MKLFRKISVYFLAGSGNYAYLCSAKFNVRQKRSRWIYVQPFLCLQTFKEQNHTAPCRDTVTPRGIRTLKPSST